MVALDAREKAFLIEKMTEVENSESSFPTEKKEAERVRGKLEQDLIE